MAVQGLMAVDYEERIDMARMRAHRFERSLEAMDRHALDALVLGKDANCRYAAGYRKTYVAGKRPFKRPATKSTPENLGARSWPSTKRWAVC